MITQQELEKIIELVWTHTEHNGDYCDTGEDMEWACRSSCTKMAVERLKKWYNEQL